MRYRRRGNMFGGWSEEQASLYRYVFDLGHVGLSESGSFREHSKAVCWLANVPWV